jgi:hypothetical protein
LPLATPSGVLSLLAGTAHPFVIVGSLAVTHVGEINSASGVADLTPHYSRRIHDIVISFAIIGVERNGHTPLPGPVDAINSLGLLTNRTNGRDENRSQDANDGDHGQQLDEGKTRRNSTQSGVEQFHDLKGTDTDEGLEGLSRPKKRSWLSAGKTTGGGDGVN